MPIHKPLSRVELQAARGRVASLTSAFDLIADHVVITDAQAHIVYANAAAERATGFGLSQMLGKNPADLWGGHMPAEFYRAMWKRIKGAKKPFVGEVRNLRKDGKAIWQELRISPVLDERKRVTFFIAVESAIGDRKRRERLQEDLTSVVSSEVLSPLTAVRWSLERSLEKRGMPAQERRHLEDLMTQNSRAISMFHDLFFIARAHQGYPEMVPLDLSQSLIEVFAASGLNIVFKKPSSPLCVVAVSSLVTECLSAILSAIANGTTHDARVICSLRRLKNRACLTMSVPVSTLRQKKSVAMELPSLIARYLHWGNLRNTRSSASARWSIDIPLAKKVLKR